MDDTTQSRSDAAATRKRRSSILKSQRPPRTPFCELEFNVCTPTDTTKSRRVSFSRRTGVAEFVTNEATTTWKNFYEEHNKSLESSGNDSADVNNLKQPIGQLGKRIFDQQFEEVEAIDFIGSMNPGMSLCTSINNINFTQQLECTDSKLLAPQNKFEFSNLTEQQSKLFGDDVAICAGEMSERIDINFSAVQQIGQTDDLDEIQKDLQRQSNVVCHGPFNGRQNMSEYIEVDLNMTHVAMTNEESDMSITDTVHSPKVQDVSKSCSIDKKMNVNKDWVTDKENIAINPYITPRESINFAINEEPDKVLVFDGKKLIVETEKPKKENYRQTLLPGASEKVPQRKTIVLNCNDDLPNFIDDEQIAKRESAFSVSELKQSVIFDGDMSITQAKVNVTQNIQKTVLYDDDLADISVTQGVAIITAPVIPLEKQKRRTIVYDNDMNNISMTQALPSKIIDSENEKRKTVIYENDNRNVSIIQPLPNVILSESKDNRKTIVIANEACNIIVTPAVPTKNIIPENVAPKRRTIVFENDNGNVSITQSIPNIVINDEKRRTVVNDNQNISSTQVQPTKICTENAAVPERRKTIVFENDVGNLSVTQALPSNIILSQKLNATKYDDDVNISMTQALPANIILQSVNKEQNRRRTVVYDDDTGNLSITQVVPTNNIQELVKRNVIVESSEIETTNELSIARKEVDVNKSSTTVFDSENVDLSMTLAVKTNKLLSGLIEEKHISNDPTVITENKRKTIIFENDAADISVTQAVPLNQVIETMCKKQKESDENVKLKTEDLPDANSKRRTIVFENEDCDISMTQTVDVKQLLQRTAKHIETTNAASHNVTNKRTTVVFENENADISITQAVDVNKVIEEIKNINSIEALKLSLYNISNKNEVKVFEDENADLSMTQGVDVNHLIQQDEQNDHVEVTKLALHNATDKRSVVFENKNVDLSVAETVNKVLKETNDYNEAIKAALHTAHKRKSVVFADGIENPSTFQAGNQVAHSNVKPMDINFKPNKIVFDENETADISMTETVEVNEVLQRNDHDNILQKEIEAATNTALHFHNNLGNKRRTLMFDDDEENTLKRSDSPIKTKYEKKRTIVVEDINTMLENKDLFMDIDKLIEESRNINEIEYDVSMTEIDGENPENDVSKVNDMSVSEEISPDSPRGTSDDKHSALLDETANNTLSKPIPAGFAFNSKLCNKSQKEKSDHSDGLLNVTAAITNVIVCQAGTVNTNSNKHSTIEEDKEQDPVTNEQQKESKPSEMNSSDIVTTSYLAKLSSLYKKTKAKHTYEHSKESGENRENIAEEPKVTETSETHAVINVSKAPLLKDSILTDLLDMSHSVDSVVVDNSLAVNVDLKDSSTEEERVRTTASVITYTVNEKDSRQQIINVEVDEVLADRVLDSINKESDPRSTTVSFEKSPVVIEYKDEDPKIDHNQEPELKFVPKENRGIHNSTRQEFNADQTEIKESSENANADLSPKNNERKSIYKKEPSPKYGKSFRMANDTNELLEMLSDFTDQRKSTNLNPHLEEDECGSEPEAVNSPVALDKKEVTVPDLLKRFSSPNEVISDPALPKTHSFMPETETSQPAHLKRHHFVSNDEESQPAESKLNPKELLEPIQLKKLTFVPTNTTSETEQPKTESFVPKAETSEPAPSRRLSLASKRQSIVLSREDLLNNLSMAGAALQKSRFDIDESDSINETTKDTPENDVSHKKSVRVSNEVVKTLHFEDDESCSETSFKTEITTTTLKKTAFGEVTYMKETKAKVIPDYLERVDDGIKELMNDLVKPMADVLPFPTSNLDRLKRTPSVRSNQIQANLQTSSQIDLGTELYSNPDSVIDTSKYSSSDVISTSVKRSTSRAFKSPCKSNLGFSQSEKSIEVDYVSQDTGIKSVIFTTPPKHERPESPGTVLIFDHNNPLNNVFLPPPYLAEAHSYNPVPSKDTIMETSIRESESGTSESIQLTDQESDREKVKFSTHYRVENKFTIPSPMKNTRVRVNADIQSKNSTNSGNAMSIDQSTDPVLSQDLRNTKVNTEIVMKANKELLAASSSLTLVDDALDRTAFDVDVESNSSQEDDYSSPVQVLYKSVESPEKPIPKLTTDDVRDKAKKRLYSPATKKGKHKDCTLSSLDVTPKPVSKMQKISTSPVYEKPTRTSENCQDNSLRSSPKSRRPGSTITVQQFITMVHQEKDEPMDVLADKGKPAHLNYVKSEVTVVPASSETPSLVSNLENMNSDITSSFTSSKNLRECNENSSEDSKVGSRRSSRMDWVPHGSLSGDSTKLLFSDSNTNIFDIIDTLPFMGSHECEWEFSNEDAWSFRLLHSRLRLTIRFQRSRAIRADTPVTDVKVETIHHDKKNPLGALCVKFAAQVMRYYIGRGCGTAGEVPKLIRQVAAAARLSARWARAMHDARVRLAYTLTNEGWLSLKVANISLRCVWEVTMQLEMVAEDARSVPWVRAGGVRVARVLGGPAPRAQDAVRAALALVPRDWGHAPRLVWKLFRLLKNKKRDDDMMLLK